MVTVCRMDTSTAQQKTAPKNQSALEPLSPWLKTTNHVIAVAPRLFAKLVEEGDAAPLGEKAWGESRIDLPGGFPTKFTNSLTGEAVAAEDGHLRLAPLLSGFPVALLLDS